MSPPGSAGGARREHERAEHSILALELLKLMVASGLEAAPMTDITPEKQKEIADPAAAALEKPGKVVGEV